MNPIYMKTVVDAALAEDVGQGDITTNSLIPATTKVEARLVFKSDGIVCGLDVAECVFKTFSKKVDFKKLVKEGSYIKKQQVIATINGSARAVLTAERVAINFLTHLSSIATHTRAVVDRIKPYSAKIYDTRKTTPLLRLMERHAVRVGGGYNHRFNLEDMGMIKDNHRSLLVKIGLKEAVQRIKDKTNKMVVLEVDTWDELKEALTSQAEIILLDNMMPSQVRKAVLLRNQVKSRILLEASGGIDLHNVRAYAQTGVDRISIGSLTSVKKGVDISLDF